MCFSLPPCLHTHKSSQGGRVYTLSMGPKYIAYSGIPSFHLLFLLNQISKTSSHDYTYKSHFSFRSCVVRGAFSRFPVAPLFQAAHTPAGQAWGECGGQPGGPSLDPPSLDGRRLPSCFPLSLASSWGPNLSWDHSLLCRAAPMASSAVYSPHRAQTHPLTSQIQLKARLKFIPCNGSLDLV